MTAREVRRIREALGMNQEQFAELICASQTAVSFWENGLRPVLPRNAELIRLKVAELQRTVPAAATA